MKVNLPPSEPPVLNHVDDHGRIKHTPPSPPSEAEPLPTDNIDHPRMTDNQKQKVALRDVYEQVRRANTEEDLEKLNKLQYHIPSRERKAFTEKLKNIKTGMENRRKLRRILQIKNLHKMARRSN